MTTSVVNFMTHQLPEKIGVCWTLTRSHQPWCSGCPDHAKKVFRKASTSFGWNSTSLAAAVLRPHPAAEWEWIEGNKIEVETARNHLDLTQICFNPDFHTGSMMFNVWVSFKTTSARCKKLKPILYKALTRCWRRFDAQSDILRERKDRIYLFNRSMSGLSNRIHRLFYLLKIGLF